MLLAAMVAKARTQENRTRGLYQFYSCFLFSELISPVISSVTADIWPPLPFIISYLLLFSAFPLLAIMPQDEASSVPIAANTYETGDVDGSPESPSVLRTFFHTSADQYRRIKFVFSSRNMRLAGAIFLVSTFRGISLRALIQYASARFGWNLSRVNGLISEVALVNLLLFFFIMPALIRFIPQRFKPSVQTLNLGIVQVSLALLFTGSLLLAFAPNSAFLIAATMIYGLGFGARSTLLSLATSWIDARRSGTLYSAVFLVEQIGMLIGEPLIPGSSIGSQAPWRGDPFLGVGIQTSCI
ncbi:hypothetical protein B0J18DRAFT_458077 [Chaetomium sp. MPI-SDFR-AT-0129]|nr:hypothetical protein B0J18DRAFT_458077 [Chaetomium sp. MPI-SDFR-AT-0129]